MDTSQCLTEFLFTTSLILRPSEGEGEGRSGIDCVCAELSAYFTVKHAMKRLIVNGRRFGSI